MEFTVPVEVNSKDFVEETIPLDAQNTEIKTNTSPERMSQIEKLNGILGTINEDAVYQITPFAQPTTITRRTSFFAAPQITPIIRFCIGHAILSAISGSFCVPR